MRDTDTMRIASGYVYPRMVRAGGFGVVCVLVCISTAHVSLAQSPESAPPDTNATQLNANQLASIEGRSLKLEGNAGKLVGYYVTDKTIMCIKHVKVNSLEEFRNLIGKTITVYTGSAAKPNSRGESYAGRVEGESAIAVGVGADLKPYMVVPETPVVGEGCGPRKTKTIPVNAAPGSH
jgi:hypothetical protein